MKIWKDVPGVSGIYDKNNNVNKNKIKNVSGIKSGNDIVSISNKAKDYQIAMNHMKNIPDIRQDKVKKISEDLESGNYDINGNKVAEKIINSVFDKKV